MGLSPNSPLEAIPELVNPESYSRGVRLYIKTKQTSMHSKSPWAQLPQILPLLLAQSYPGREPAHLACELRRLTLKWANLSTHLDGEQKEEDNQGCVRRSQPTYFY